MTTALTTLLLSTLIGLSLGLLGGGGSMLTVPLLVYVVGLEPKVGFATSTVVVGSTALIAMTQHARRGNVRWRTGAIFAITSMLGAYASSSSARWINGGTLMLLFAGMMIAAAVAMFVGRAGLDERVTETPQPLTLGLAGVVVGALTGMVGAGGGFVIVPTLVLFAGMRMHAAVGTSLLVIALKSAAGLAGYAGHTPIAWDSALLVTIGAISGTFFGTLLATKMSGASLKRGFAAMLVGMAVLLIRREASTEALLGVVALWPLWLILLIGGGIAAARRR